MIVEKSAKIFEKSAVTIIIDSELHKILSLACKNTRWRDIILRRVLSMISNLTDNTDRDKLWDEDVEGLQSSERDQVARKRAVQWLTLACKSYLMTAKQANHKIRIPRVKMLIDLVTPFS